MLGIVRLISGRTAEVTRLSGMQLVNQSLNSRNGGTNYLFAGAMLLTGRTDPEWLWVIRFPAVLLSGVWIVIS